MTRDKLSITLKTNSRAARSSFVKFWDFQFREVPDSRKGFERLAEIKLRSSTFDNCEITAWSSEICIISSDDGEDLFADELLVCKEWKARYEVEE